jgi:hypothetical protein
VIFNTYTGNVQSTRIQETCSPRYFTSTNFSENLSLSSMREAIHKNIRLNYSSLHTIFVFLDSKRENKNFCIEMYHAFHEIRVLFREALWSNVTKKSLEYFNNRTESFGSRGVFIRYPVKSLATQQILTEKFVLLFSSYKKIPG